MSAERRCDTCRWWDNTGDYGRPIPDPSGIAMMDTHDDSRGRCMHFPINPIKGGEEWCGAWEPEDDKENTMKFSKVSPEDMNGGWDRPAPGAASSSGVNVLVHYSLSSETYKRLMPHLAGKQTASETVAAMEDLAKRASALAFKLTNWEGLLELAATMGELEGPGATEEHEDSP